jgi:hypothetical protein
MAKTGNGHTELEQDLVPQRSFLRKAMRLIPGVGFIDYISSGDAYTDLRSNKIKSNNILFAHLTGAILAGTYLALSWGFDSLNPTKWSEPIRRNRQTLQQQQVKNQRAYDDLYNQLFGTNGLADVDGDGRVSYTEKMDYFDRTGCLQYGVGPVQITRKPRTNDLQKAIDSYRTEK